MKRKLLTAILILASPPCLASPDVVGTLNTVHFMPSGVVVFYLAPARQVADAPSCASSFPDRFALDATATAGKVQLSGLLTAYATGKTVHLFGAGTCAVFTGTETLGYFYTVD